MNRVIKAAALIALGSLFHSWSASAATYNIYFNNAEQGNNSKATPTVIVGDDGKPAKTDKAVDDSSVPMVTPTQTQQATPVAAPAPAATPQSPTFSPVSNFHEDYSADTYNHGRYPNFRVMAGASLNKVHSVTSKTPFNSDPYSNQPFWEQTTDSTTQKTSPNFEASYFWYPTFGASLVVSDLSGFELTFVPFGNPGGHFIQPEISLGLLTSLSNVTFAGGPEVGAKIAFNFTRSVALVVGARASVVRDGDYNFIQGTAGLAYNF